ncbi:Usp domain-containing protein [Citrus sinensis]|nr:Usp domain-containing protein [Citrus sinensis]
MDVKKIVVIVEDVDAARAALLWALQNLLRFGDVVTLLHVFPSLNSRNRKKLRLLRLKGYQLALSFKDICNDFFNTDGCYVVDGSYVVDIDEKIVMLQTNVEIIVTEGDQEGARIAALVREIGASALVVGLHDRSFLHKLAMSHNDISSSFNCRVLAIKQPAASPQLRTQTSAATTPDRSSNLDFSLSQIEIDRLE